MGLRPRAGGERGVADAGHRVQVGVEGLLVTRALVDQAAQSAGPRRAITREVAGSHLVDDHQHQQRRARGRAGLPRLRRPTRTEQQRDGEHAAKAQGQAR